VNDNAFSSYRGNLPRTAAELQAWHATSPSEDAIEPGLPIVDPHHHLFGTAADALHYRREDLARDLASGHRVMGTVYVEAYSSGWHTTGPEALRSLGEVDMIVRASAAPVQAPHGTCQVAAGIVTNVDLELGDAAGPVLQAHEAAARGRLRGVRHRATHVGGSVGALAKHPSKPGVLADRAFRQGFAWLGRMGMGFDAWLYHTQLGELAGLADAFPDTTIVLNHAGGVIGVAEFRAQHADVMAGWRRDMRALARRPNVHVKVGGMGMALFGFGFEAGARPASSDALARAWQPYIDTCLETFGPRRCMFESNFPVDKQSCGYVELWNAFKRATKSLAPAERAHLFYRTACSAYRLPELERACDQAGTHTGTSTGGGNA